MFIYILEPIEYMPVFSVLFYKAIPINCFVSHRPTDPLFFKVPFKENVTDP